MKHKYTEKEIDDNIEFLYLITLFYFPCISRSDIPRIICKALYIPDEATQTYVKVQCILYESGYKDKGLFKKGYFDNLPNDKITRSILTKQGLSKLLLYDCNVKPLDSILRDFAQYNKKINGRLISVYGIDEEYKEFLSKYQSDDFVM
ncbi:MAG: hypothetical protein IJ731_02085 [Eubacterium sp.]|nr:hypothetical protein [Eubacterium sp.]